MTKPIGRLCAVALALALAGARPTSAAVEYSSLGEPGDTYNAGAVYSFTGQSFFDAFSFPVAFDGTLSSIDLAVFSSSYGQVMSLLLYASDPATNLPDVTTRQSLGSVRFTDTSVALKSVLIGPGIAVTAGRTYWLALNESLGFNYMGIALSSNGSTDFQASSTNYGTTYSALGGSRTAGAFRVNAAPSGVPEPPVWAMIGLGGIGLAGFSTHRRRSPAN